MFVDVFRISISKDQKKHLILLDGAAAAAASAVGTLAEQ